MHVLFTNPFCPCNTPVLLAHTLSSTSGPQHLWTLALIMGKKFLLDWLGCICALWPVRSELCMCNPVAGLRMPSLLQAWASWACIAQQLVMHVHFSPALGTARLWPSVPAWCGLATKAPWTSSELWTWGPLFYSILGIEAFLWWCWPCNMLLTTSDTCQETPNFFKMDFVSDQFNALLNFFFYCCFLKVVSWK